MSQDKQEAKNNAPADDKNKPAEVVAEHASYLELHYSGDKANVYYNDPSEYFRLYYRY